MEVTTDKARLEESSVEAAVSTLNSNYKLRRIENYFKQSLRLMAKRVH